MTPDEQYVQEERPGQADRLVLRLLTGVQRGAEMPLSAASYRIGRGDDCDIVLADDTVSESHATLTVAGQGVTLDAEDGEILFDDQLLAPGQRAVLELPVALTFGQLVVAVGEQATNWHALPITDTRPPEPAAAVEDEEEVSPASDEMEATVAESEPEASDAEADEPASESGETITVDATGGEQQPKIPPRMRVIGVAAAIVLLTITVPLGVRIVSKHTVNVSDGANASVPAAPSPQETAQKIAGRMGFDEMDVVPLGNDDVMLRGYLPTAEEQEALRAALSEEGIVYADRTRSVEQVLDAVRTALDGVGWPEPNFRGHLVASYRGNGEVDIDGFLGPEVDKSVLHRSLRNDVPGVAAFNFSRSDLSFWRQHLDQRIRDAGLPLWLATARDGARIKVTGKVSEAEAKAWRAVGEAFIEESGGYPKLEIAVTSASLEPARTQDVPEAEVASQPTKDPKKESTFSSFFNGRTFEKAIHKVETDLQSVVGTPNHDPFAKDVRNGETATPSGSVGLSGDLAVIGVIVARGTPSHALLSDGRTLVVGDDLREGERISKIAMDRITVQKGDKDIFYRVRAGK